MRAIVPAVMMSIVSFQAAGQPRPENWVAVSNAYTQQMSEVQFRHSPEEGSAEGLAQFDTKVSDPSRADEDSARHEYEAVLARYTAAQSQEKDPRVIEDLSILRGKLDLQFRQEDFANRHLVPFRNASNEVFQGLVVLLDDQVAPQRRAAAVERLRRYAGLAPGSEPYTVRLRRRVEQQIAMPDVIYPSRTEITTELGRNASYLTGIPELFRKYHLRGWERPFAELKRQLIDYDAWVRVAVLPKARTDFRLLPEQYALELESYGVDIPPAQLASEAKAAFARIQVEMAPLAARIAQERGYPDSGYRAVIHELKRSQLVGAAILPFYTERLHAIEKIIVERNLVSLPARPAIIRLASDAESAQVPAPHMLPPPLLNNHGERGQFVLPLNIPAAPGSKEDRFDDFTYDAVAWTLTAHEARPGHELQFDSMIEHGVSVARALYAFNSTNAEGWGLYAEYILQPYEPPEGQLAALQMRLQRAARAFLDPGLQSGEYTPQQAREVMEKDVCLSHALATEEVERFTYRSPGQANSYFYGLTRLLALRSETEAALGAKFDQRRFHDFLLAQGLLPPDLMRRAVLEDFVPSQR